jgi:hypothetical protein
VQPEEEILMETMPTEAMPAATATAQPMPQNPEQPAMQPEEQIDLAEIKTMLDLPATASDIELITVLVNLVASLQEKYERLLADAVAMEDAITNRDLSDYADVIDQQTLPFWKEQILQNRTIALEALEAIRGRMDTEEESAPPPSPVIPLRNRLEAINRTVSDVAEPKPVAAESDGTAFRIRNRAHQIASSEKVPFIIAFARAEKEYAKEKAQ